ncbi:MAG: aminotransferase class V-fold PLP-dependent enzyme [Oscillospiraceae bacterium]|nr:aminotransferase class V-fold PLP-dependent enzyme [Oscillospiraceae bacterium]
MSNISAYFDNGATTKISDRALEAMLPFLREQYGNPSSIYTLGREAAKAISRAREQVALALNCEPGEIFFTGSGSEANNWILKSYGNIIMSEFEHHAVLHAVKSDSNITLLPVYDKGFVKVADLKAAITPETELVSVMFANNEIGTIQPIAEIGAACKEWREKGVLFHTDAVQAVGSVPIDVKAMNIDMLSLSAHKFHGPKGVGALYVRKAVQKSLSSFIQGGAQESGKRAGTENVAGIVGLGAALEEAVAGIDAKNAALLAKRERICSAVLALPKVRLNGDLQSRLAGNLNFSFAGIEGEALLLLLDMGGIAASSGSACTSGSLDPSHVLLALGLPHEIAHGSLRITMSRYTTDEEVDLLLAKLPLIVERLRTMSPIWNN